ncbi:MAG: helix-turn-helix domain-containing protein [Rhodospirillaceae bacterium]|nr:helix-turn-helix domain-containing protein [Rhodospirillaceae bacterium]
MEGLERALNVLRVLNQYSGATVSELARLTAMPRAAVNRYIVTFMKLGYVFRPGQGRGLRVSARALDLSRGAQTDGWVTTEALPEMSALCRDIGWPIGLESIVGARLAILANTDAMSPFVTKPFDPQITFPLVGRASAHVLLAFTNPETREDLLQCALAEDPALLSRVGMTAKKLAAKMAEVRSQGYDVQRVARASWIVIAVPVLNSGQARFSLSVRFRPSAVPLEKAITRFIPKLNKAASQIAKGVSRLNQVET